MDAANQLVFEKTVVRSEKELVEQWLGQLDVALQSESRASVASLFAPDGHWRDLLAFTWSITPCQGAEDIAALMVAQPGKYPSARVCHRRRTHAAASRSESRGRCHRGHLPVRDGGRTRLRCGEAAGRGAFQGLSAHDRPARAQRLRGKDRQAPADRSGHFAQLRRSQLEGRAHRQPGVCRPRSHGAGRRRRPGRAFHCGHAGPAGRGHPGRRPP